VSSDGLHAGVAGGGGGGEGGGAYSAVHMRPMQAGSEKNQSHERTPLGSGGEWHPTQVALSGRRAVAARARPSSASMSGQRRDVSAAQRALGVYQIEDGVFVFTLAQACWHTLTGQQRHINTRAKAPMTWTYARAGIQLVTDSSRLRPLPSSSLSRNMHELKRRIHTAPPPQARISHNADPPQWRQCIARQTRLSHACWAPPPEHGRFWGSGPRLWGRGWGHGRGHGHHADARACCRDRSEARGVGSQAEGVGTGHWGECQERREACQRELEAVWCIFCFEGQGCSTPGF